MTARPHGHRTGALSPEEITTILRMSADGATSRDIARALGRSPVNMGLLIHNVRLRRGGRPKAAPTEATRPAAGESEADTIARHIARHGVTRVDPGRARGSVIARHLDFVL